MADYFVDPIGGNDSTGTGAVGAPWATIGKAIGTSPAITMSGSGDTLWLIPSGPHRQRNVTLALTPGAGNVLTIRGDYDGTAQRAAGSTTPITGPCVWTAYTTSDTTFPADTNSVLLLGGKSYVTIQSLAFVGGRNATAAVINASTTGSANITILSCSFNSLLSGAVAIGATIAANATAPNWLVDSCVIMSLGGGIGFTLTQSASSEYSITSTVQNCLIFAQGNCVQTSTAGATTFNGYGVTILNCTLWGGRGAQTLGTTGTGTATNYQITALNCLVIGGSNSFSCQNATNTHLDEDYNVLYGTLTNVTSGGHSVSTGGSTAYAAGAHLGEERLFGMVGRPFLMPQSGSALLGFGAGGTPPALDFSGKARPAGGGSLTGAAGYLERQDTGAKETSTVQAGSNSLKIAGPGSQELRLAVDATSTTISLYTYADANHGTGTPPQVMLLANGEIGVAAQTVTMSPSTTGQWNSVSLSPFTPAAAGVVTLRLVSRPTAANGIAFFDTISVS